MTYSISSLAFLLILFTSCAGFKNDLCKTADPNENNIRINDLNGTYDLIAIDRCIHGIQSHPIEFDRSFDNAYRQLTNKRVDIPLDQKDFRIQILPKDRVEFTFTNSDSTINRITYTYKIDRDGFISLNNKKTIIKGIPFLFGNIRQHRTRIAVNELGQLIIDDDTYIGGGLLFLIFADSKHYETKAYYGKIY